MSIARRYRRSASAYLACRGRGLVDGYQQSVLKERGPTIRPKRYVELFYSVMVKSLVPLNNLNTRGFVFQSTSCTKGLAGGGGVGYIPTVAELSPKRHAKRDSPEHLVSGVSDRGRL